MQRRIGAMTFCGVFLALTACTTKESSTTERPQQETSSAASESTGNPKGVLPPGWETNNSEELRAIANSITWTTPTPGKRQCAGPKNCPGGTVDATVSANVDARLITAGNSADGAIIGRMMLDGKVPDAMYRMVPGAFEYYVVVLPGAAGMGWKLVQVADNGKGPIKVIGSGPFTSCGHLLDTSEPVGAKWSGCDQKVKPASYQPPVRDSSGDTGGDKPAWISCVEGCCTVTAIEGNTLRQHTQLFATVATKPERQ